MGGNHERPLTSRERVIQRSFRIVTRLLEADVLIALLHLLLTAAVVFGLIHGHSPPE